MPRLAQPYFISPARGFVLSTPATRGRYSHFSSCYAALAVPVLIPVVLRYRREYENKLSYSRHVPQGLIK
jgi:hypothetical protein